MLVDAARYGVDSVRAERQEALRGLAARATTGARLELGCGCLLQHATCHAQALAAAVRRLVAVEAAALEAQQRGERAAPTPEPALPDEGGRRRPREPTDQTSCAAAAADGPPPPPNPPTAPHHEPTSGATRTARDEARGGAAAGGPSALEELAEEDP